MSFKQYLRNYLEAKNTHQEHLEDEVLNAGNKGIQRAVTILKSLIGKDDKAYFTIKFDGSPAVVFGTLTDDRGLGKKGEFFISTKSFFNKDPLVCTSKEHVKQQFEGGLQEVLLSVFDGLKQTKPKGIFQGDLMWNPIRPAVEKTINGIKAISWKPNTIVYAVPESESQLYDVVKKAKIGIVAHTRYNGENASFDVSAKDFSPAKDVWMGFAKVEGMSPITAETKTTIEENIKKIETITINDKLFDELKKLKPDYILKTFINAMIKEESVVVGDIDKFVNKFKDWHANRTEKEKAKVTSESSKQSKQATYDMNIGYIENNKTDFMNMLKVYQIINESKLAIVNDLNKMKSSTTMWLAEGDKFRPTSAEGYVAVMKSDNTINKLVNRLEFSAANFATGKPNNDGEL